MTRLVLHAGAEFADGGTVQQDLVSWRSQLREVSVVVPAADSATEWREAGQGLLKGKVSGAAKDLLDEASRVDAEIVLVSSDALADTLTSPADVAVLAQTAAEAGLEPRVVVVVREQVGYINSLYCRRVLALETARTFTEFATTSVPAHRFDYVASFGAIADTEGVELAAIGYPTVAEQGGARAVLAAAGLADEALARLPEGGTPVPEVPGPVVVGAVRLLHKRLRRQGMFNDHGKPRLRLRADELAAHATDREWDSQPFWGWDSALQRQVEEEYSATNGFFAQFVWGTDWPYPWSTGKPVRPDLADLKPAVLLDVFSTVDRLLRDIGKGPTQPSYDDLGIAVEDDTLL